MGNIFDLEIIYLFLKGQYRHDQQGMESKC